jgi:hypothetical protein
MADCVDEIVSALGGRKTRAEVEAELNALDESAQRFEQAGSSFGATPYSRAGEQRLRRVRAAAGITKRIQRCIF